MGLLKKFISVKRKFYKQVNVNIKRKALCSSLEGEVTELTNKNLTKLTVLNELLTM